MKITFTRAPTITKAAIARQAGRPSSLNVVRIWMRRAIARMASAPNSARHATTWAVLPPGDPDHDVTAVRAVPDRPAGQACSSAPAVGGRCR